MRKLFSEHSLDEKINQQEKQIQNFIMFMKKAGITMLMLTMIEKQNSNC